MTYFSLLRRRAVWVPLFLVGIYVCGLASVLFAPRGTNVAIWWPGAGLAVVLVLFNPRRSWWLLWLGVAASSGLANFHAGRPLDAALGFGLSNATEAVVVGYWLTRNVSGKPALRTQDDLWRLLSGTALGTLVMGIGGGLTAAATLGGHFLETARTVQASHGASILVIVPLALLRAAPLRDWPRREAALQWFTLLVVSAYVFRPGQALALAFLPMPVLAWGAFRAGSRTVSLQLFAVSLITTAMSARGWGPFSVGEGGHLRDVATTGSLTQSFLIACAVIALPLAVAIEQRATALAQVSESEELFRKSFSDSMVGMALLRYVDGSLQIAEVNGTAAEILGSPSEHLVGHNWCEMLSTATTVTEVVRELLTGAREGWREELTLAGDSGRRVGISLSMLSGRDQDPMFTAQMMDVTAAYEATHRLRTEKDFTSAVLDTTGCVIVVVDIDGTVVGMNPAAQSVTGFGEREVMDRPLWETLVPPDDRDAVRASFASPGGAAIPLTQESDLATKGGARRRITWSSAFLTDDHGNRTHVVMTGLDVTSERTTRGLVSHLMRAAIKTAFIGTDLEGRVTVWNSGAEEMLGYAAREIIGEPLPSGIFDAAQVAERAGALGIPEDLRVLTAHLEYADTPETRDWTCVRLDGTRSTVSLTVSPVTDAFGQRIGYLGVGNDVTEQRRSQGMLVAALEKERQAVDRLRQLDQAKSDFVSTVSHELRTPITSISGYTEMLQDGAAGDLSADQQRLVDAVRRNGDRLIALADDLLTLSSFEAGTVSLERTVVDLRDVVARAQEALQPLVTGRRVYVSYDLPGTPVNVRGDAGHLERVVFNLISNAVKFTDDGGTVSCTLGNDLDDALLEVRDDGIGIPAEEQGDLFTRFFRSSTAQERAIQGTGLGLSIVASIVKTHGGDITVESAHLAGTTFTVRLPLTERPAYVGSHAAR